MSLLVFDALIVNMSKPALLQHNKRKAFNFVFRKFFQKQAFRKLYMLFSFIIKRTAIKLTFPRKMIIMPF